MEARDRLELRDAGFLADRWRECERDRLLVSLAGVLAALLRPRLVDRDRPFACPPPDAFFAGDDGPLLRVLTIFFSFYKRTLLKVEILRTMAMTIYNIKK